MSKQPKVKRQFAVCLSNPGFEASLERNKIYVLVPDADAADDGDVRVIDESGNDYLYPADWFVPIDVPKAVESALLKAS